MDEGVSQSRIETLSRLYEVIQNEGPEPEKQKAHYVYEVKDAIMAGEPVPVELFHKMIEIEKQTADVFAGNPRNEPLRQEFLQEAELFNGVCEDLPGKAYLVALHESALWTHQPIHTEGTVGIMDRLKAIKNARSWNIYAESIIPK